MTRPTRRNKLAAYPPGPAAKPAPPLIAPPRLNRSGNAAAHPPPNLPPVEPAGRGGTSRDASITILPSVQEMAVSPTVSTDWKEGPRFFWAAWERASSSVGEEEL
jgi:hypothetical protein